MTLTQAVSITKGAVPHLALAQIWSGHAEDPLTSGGDAVIVDTSGFKEGRGSSFATAASKAAEREQPFSQFEEPLAGLDEFHRSFDADRSV